MKQIFAALFFSLAGLVNQVYACSPLNIPSINNLNVVGNNLVMNAQSNTVYNCSYSIQVEIVCNNKNFTGVAPFFFTSPLYAKNATPFAIPQMSIPLGALCAGTQYKVRIREVYPPATFSGWSTQQVFTTPGTFIQPVLTASANPANICLPQTSQLSANLSNSCGGGPIGYTWSPSGSLSCVNCANPVASPQVSTTYTVVSSGGPTGCWTASAVVAVIVATVPPSVGTVTAPASV
ncbi:MAG: hypothetical protein JNM96_07160, partial [Bacteroidia bacterium]|nr:hypothetical protein [Bacteroidia bacterium]